MKIGILNAGVGSIHSLENSLRLLGYSSDVLSNHQSLSEYSHLILPGVGHFDQGASFIAGDNWKQPILKFLNDPKKRLLGICLGMQLLFSSSEESSDHLNGLSFFKLSIQRLPDSDAKVPNLGWLPVYQKQSDADFISKSVHSHDFYFVHSYALIMKPYMDLSDIFDEYAISWHGQTPFVSMFRASNIYGCQFHPEKSSSDGLKLLKSFLD